MTDFDPIRKEVMHEAPIIPHDVGPGVRADAPSGEGAFALARRELVRRHEAALAAADSCAMGDKARSFTLGIASGIDLAVLLFDAVRADRGTGAVSAETIFALAQHHPMVDLARRAGSARRRLAEATEHWQRRGTSVISSSWLSAGTGRALERLQAALDDAFSGDREAPGGAPESRVHGPGLAGRDGAPARPGAGPVRVCMTCDARIVRDTDAQVDLAARELGWRILPRRTGRARRVSLCARCLDDVRDLATAASWGNSR